MKTRISIFLLCPLLFLIPFTKSYAQDDLSVLSTWKYYSNQPGYLYKYLSENAFEKLEQRKTAVQKINTKQDWIKRQAFVRNQLKKSFTNFQQNSPLNPVITGTIQRDGMTVEKLYYESLPHYFVSAALFMPTERRGKLPVILFCSGHTPLGFRSPVYQHMILNYVKKGFAVFAFDPIGQGERIQYFDSDGKSKLSPTKEHSYPGTQVFVAGMSPAYYFVQDGIRAIDYLTTRPEIDSNRIGITGRSGGGTQTTYLAAMDERIKAAAPECYVTTFDKLLRTMGPQDAEQNLISYISNGLDLADFLQVRAPKPTLMVTTTRDIFSIEGAREVYEETKAVFKAFGKADYFSMVEDDDGHASTLKNREATYAFFQKHLNNPGNNQDEKTVPFTEEQLNATPNGNVFSSLNSETLFSINKKYSQKRVVEKAATLLNDKTLVSSITKATGYTPSKNFKEIIFSGRFQRKGYTIEKYLIKSKDDYMLPVLWLKPLQKKTGAKAVLYLNESGKSEAVASGSAAEQLVLAGHDVILPDLSGAGELSKTYMESGDAIIEGVPLNLWYTGLLVDKSLVAVRMEELDCLLNFIQTKTENKVPVSAVATGTLTSDLAHYATLYSQKIDKIILANPLVSYQSIINEINYVTRFIPSTVAGAIASYDLPDLYHNLAQKHPLMLISPVNASNEKCSEEALRKNFNLKNSALPNWIALNDSNSTQQLIEFITKH